MAGFTVQQWPCLMRFLDRFAALNAVHIRPYTSAALCLTTPATWRVWSIDPTLMEFYTAPRGYGDFGTTTTNQGFWFWGFLGVFFRLGFFGFYCGAFWGC